MRRLLGEALISIWIPRGATFIRGPALIRGNTVKQAIITFFAFFLLFMTAGHKTSSMSLSNWLPVVVESQLFSYIYPEFSWKQFFYRKGGTLTYLKWKLPS